MADLSLRAALTIATFAGASLVLPGFGPRGERPAPGSREHAVLRLETRATIVVRDLRLADAVRAVSAATGLTIVPRWSDDLGTAVLDPERPVSIELHDASAAAIIERLTAEASDAAAADLAWQITGIGEIELGPKSVLNRRRETRVYDLRDLVFHVPDFDEAARLDLNAALAQSGGGGTGCFYDESDRPAVPSPEDRMIDLVELLCATVEPEQWAHLGGDGATIRRHGGSIVVVAPDYIHRQIAGLSGD